MNIFILDKNIKKSCEFYIDAHVNKIILEISQILCTVLNLQDFSSPYKSTHVNHPLSKWVRESKANFVWTIKMGLALCKEFEYRRNKKHKCEEIIKSCKKVINKLNFEKRRKTEHPICMDEKFKIGNNVVYSYRHYYIKDKQYDKNGKYMFVWTKRQRPDWSCKMSKIQKLYLEHDNMIYDNIRPIKLFKVMAYDIEIIDKKISKIYHEKGDFYIPTVWIRDHEELTRGMHK